MKKAKTLNFNVLEIQNSTKMKAPEQKMIKIRDK